MAQYLIILLTGLIFSACGFYMYIYFFSLGYGFSIAAIGAVMLFMFRGSLTWGTALQCLLFMVYGIRLGGYLLIRELKSPAYKKVLNPEMTRSRNMGMVPKVSIWISCALLYTLEVCPVFFRLKNGDGTNAAVIAGLIIMALGICLEIAADLQKSAAKKTNPYRFVDTGLYRIVRCPNYLGELLLWLGVLISGIGSLHGILQWGAALFGFILIVYIMFSGARRLEIRQDKNYGNDPEYQKYVTTVPILLPFIPLYSVKKHKWLVA
jgi:steroid 5-alpha reductase family enzyme